MSKFNSFRRKLEVNDNCIARHESAFIVDSTSAVVIHNKRLNTSQNAAIIITDKEGPDTSLVYTYKERALELELLKGDYYTWENNEYFVYEDVQLTRNLSYKKQKSYQCNVNITYNNIVVGGYFVSSLARYVSTSLQNNLNITSNDQPILILPICDWLEVGIKIHVKNASYKIVDIDDCTNNNIAYCSLTRDFVDKQADVEPSEEYAIIAGIEQTLPINNGVFTANHKVDIVRKADKEVTIIVPYGINELIVTTQDANNNEAIFMYKVVI